MTEKDKDTNIETPSTSNLSRVYLGIDRLPPIAQKIFDANIKSIETEYKNKEEKKEKARDPKTSVLLSASKHKNQAAEKEKMNDKSTILQYYQRFLDAGYILIPMCNKPEDKVVHKHPNFLFNNKQKYDQDNDLWRKENNIQDRIIPDPKDPTKQKILETKLSQKKWYLKNKYITSITQVEELLNLNYYIGLLLDNTDLCVVDFDEKWEVAETFLEKLVQLGLHTLLYVDKSPKGAHLFFRRGKLNLRHAIKTLSSLNLRYDLLLEGQIILPNGVDRFLLDWGYNHPLEVEEILPWYFFPIGPAKEDTLLGILQEPGRTVPFQALASSIYKANLKNHYGESFDFFRAFCLINNIICNPPLSDSELEKQVLPYFTTYTKNTTLVATIPENKVTSGQTSHTNTPVVVNAGGKALVYTINQKEIFSFFAQWNLIKDSGSEAGDQVFFYNQDDLLSYPEDFLLKDVRSIENFILFNTNENKWYFYNINTGIWDKKKNSDVETFINKFFKLIGMNFKKARERREFIYTVYWFFERKFSREARWKNERYLVFSNGVYDRDKEELLEFNPEFYLTRAYSFPYTKGAYPSQFINFLKFAFYNQEDHIYLIRALLKLSLLSLVNLFQVYLELVGITRTGKSTITRVIQACHFAEDVKVTSYENLSKNRFEGANIEKYKVIIVNECPQFVNLDPSLLKALTGGDAIRTESKYKGVGYGFFCGLIIFVGNDPIVFDSKPGDFVLTNSGPKTLQALTRRRIRLRLNRQVDSGEVKSDLIAFNNIEGSFEGVFVNELPEILSWGLDLKLNEIKHAFANMAEFFPNYINQKALDDPSFRYDDPKVLLLSSVNEFFYSIIKITNKEKDFLFLRTTKIQMGLYEMFLEFRKKTFDQLAQDIRRNDKDPKKFLGEVKPMQFFTCLEKILSSKMELKDFKKKKGGFGLAYLGLKLKS